MSNEVLWRIVDSITGAVYVVSSATQPTITPGGNAPDDTKTRLVDAEFWQGPDGQLFYSCYDPSGAQTSWLLTIGGGGAKIFTKITTGCRLTDSANQSIANATFTPLTFDTERYDSDAMHDGANPTRITINKAGRYLVGGSANFDANAVGTRFCGIRLNGGSFIAVITVPAVVSALTGTAQSISTVWSFAAGDYVELVLWQNSGVALDALKAADYSPEFFAQKIDGGG